MMDDDGSDTNSVDTASEGSVEVKIEGTTTKKFAARKAFNKNDPANSKYIHDVYQQTTEPHQGYAIIPIEHFCSYACCYFKSFLIWKSGLI